MVQKVDQKTLNMGTIVILSNKNQSLAREEIQATNLVRHDHQPAISQTSDIRVFLVMLQSHDLLDVLDLFVLHNLIVLCFADVEQFSAKREHAKIVTSHDTKSSDSQGFGRVSLRQDKGTTLRVSCPGIVGVGQLGHASKTVVQ